MLMTVLFLLLIFLLVCFITVRLKRRERQATRRRHPREPQLGQQALETQVDIKKQHNVKNDFKNFDADDALGLKSKTPEYITIHIMAPREYPYNGYELLQALLANGLRYGAMNIFHRHETKTGRGRVLFSLASANKPGTFELSKMGSFSCPGLTLFMILNNLSDPMNAFDAMLETARQLVEDLGGELWNEQREVLNMDKVAKIRTRIKQFEEKQRIPDFFAQTQTE